MCNLKTTKRFLRHILYYRLKAIYRDGTIYGFIKDNSTNNYLLLIFRNNKYFFIQLYPLMYKSTFI